MPDICNSYPPIRRLPAATTTLLASGTLVQQADHYHKYHSHNSGMSNKVMQTVPSMGQSKKMLEEAILPSYIEHSTSGC